MATNPSLSAEDLAAISAAADDLDAAQGEIAAALDSNPDETAPEETDGQPEEPETPEAPAPDLTEPEPVATAGPETGAGAPDEGPTRF